MNLLWLRPVAAEQSLSPDERRVRDYIDSPGGVSESASSLADKMGISPRRCRGILERLVEQGRPSLLIRVLKANTPARRFYEALGGRLVLEEQVRENGATLAQVGYGWDDVHELLYSRR